MHVVLHTPTYDDAHVKLVTVECYFEIEKKNVTLYTVASLSLESLDGVVDRPFWIEASILARIPCLGAADIGGQGAWRHLKWGIY